MEQASAFAPCHITGVFQIFDQEADALRVGSKGAGVSLNLGAKTTVRVQRGSKHRLKIGVRNQRVTSALVSREVMKIFLQRFPSVGNYHVEVEHEIAAPIGAGFGTSGAAALSLALAFSDVMDLGISRIEAAQIAHIAEIRCRTGLGTVIAETYGGLEIRVKPGAPAVGEIVCVPVPENSVVACHVFGPLSTRKFLSDPITRSRINSLGGKAVESLIQAPTVANFMKLSRKFAEHVGLITANVRAILDKADKASIVCSMPMFGDCVFAMIDEDGIDEVLQIFQQYQTGRTIICGVNQGGAQLLN